MNVFQKIGASLKKTRENFTKRLNALFSKKIDSEFFDNLEEILITSDIGMETAETITDSLRKRVREKKLEDSEDVREELIAIIGEMLGGGADIETAETADSGEINSSDMADSEEGNSSDIADSDENIPFKKAKFGKKNKLDITNSGAVKTSDTANSGAAKTSQTADGLKVILVIGVNGAGKTTTIGKLSARLKAEGKRVIIAAADTFRAAAVEQIEIWANRAGVEIIKRGEGTDPASVVYDALDSAKARRADVLVIDTAGRLHNKKSLMDELKKIRRIIGDKGVPAAATETLLVLDATTGQNAVSQARLFNEACGVTGIVLTKLDGTAKGGIIIPIAAELKIPVKYIGTGEQIDDIAPFDARAFTEGLFKDTKNDSDSEQ